MRCIDAWSHVPHPGTHRHWVVENPRSGLLQGAEEYLRSVAARRGTHREIAAMLNTEIQEWDEQHSGTGIPQPATA
ncbi:hypothetical protein ACFXI6_50890 [Streptomyces mirabilis]|uniref:hypothetical protein n=1 Tax=Streptomyces mirabilis TaxID=68239 RepID=UPI0036913DF6